MTQKTVGQRILPTDPASSLARAQQIICEAHLLAKHLKPRGFIFKARTWDEYEAWKKAQPNPRLW